MALHTLDEALSLIKDSDQRFYCYVIFDPRKEPARPFYVGIGTRGPRGERLAHHESHARNGYRSRKNNVIRKILELGLSPMYQIAGTFDSRDDAVAMEFETIASIGRLDLGKGPLVNHTDGGDGISGAVGELQAKQLAPLQKGRVLLKAMLDANEHIRREHTSRAGKASAAKRDKEAHLQACTRGGVKNAARWAANRDQWVKHQRETQRDAQRAKAPVRQRCRDLIANLGGEMACIDGRSSLSAWIEFEKLLLAAMNKKATLHSSNLAALGPDGPAACPAREGHL